MNDKIIELKKFMGGNKKLADALGIRREAVCQWSYIPEGRAYQIELITKGRFKAHELNPKIDPESYRIL